MCYIRELIETFEFSKQLEADKQAANWFHQKWGIPLRAYQESICDCLKNKNVVPQWYLAMDNHVIVGGLGVIENDFHNRKDLTPNMCAVYVDEDYRCQGIAGKLLQYVCDDMKEQGIDTLYLVITDKPIQLGKQMIFDKTHRNGVYKRVYDKIEIVNDIYKNPTKYNFESLEYPVMVALRELALEEV